MHIRYLILCVYIYICDIYVCVCIINWIFLMQDGDLERGFLQKNSSLSWCITRLRDSGGRSQVRWVYKPKLELGPFLYRD